MANEVRINIHPQLVPPYYGQNTGVAPSKESVCCVVGDQEY